MSGDDFPAWAGDARRVVLREGAAAEVWSVAGLSTEETEKAAVLLDGRERERAKRFRFERDRRCFIGSRAILRLLLGRYLNAEPAAIRFQYGPAGKPELSGEGDLRFNLSHSEDRALLAFARGREVGVDLENAARMGTDWRFLARRVCSAREQAVLMSLPEQDGQAAFLRAWTCKEAYLKATGEGLVDALDEIEFDIEPGQPLSFLGLPKGGDVTVWSVRDVPVWPGWIGALVVSAAAA